MRRRGQTQHAFSVIFIGIVVVAILFLGVKFIGLLTGKGCEAEQKQFVQELDRMLDSYSTYGTRQTVTLQAPCEGERLCVLGRGVAAADVSGSDDPDTPAIVENQLRIAAEDTDEDRPNVFIVRDDTLEDVAADLRIDIAEDPITGDAPPFMCFKNTDGIFKMRLLGQTSTILFSQP